MQATFSLWAEIDYYPITVAFPIMHTSYDLIRWLRTLSTESHEVMILRSTTIHFQTAVRTADARIIYDGEERRKKKETRKRKKGRREERESQNHNRGALRKIKYARSAIPIFRPDRILKRGWGMRLASISCGRARVRISRIARARRSLHARVALG